MKKTLIEIEKKYDLEIMKIINEIKKQREEIVVLQFPEALKPYATAIADEIEKKSGAQCLIWMGSCFGACDLPTASLKNLKPKINRLIQFGHSAWND